MFGFHHRTGFRDLWPTAAIFNTNKCCCGQKKWRNSNIKWSTTTCQPEGLGFESSPPKILTPGITNKQTNKKLRQNVKTKIRLQITLHIQPWQLNKKLQDWFFDMLCKHSRVVFYIYIFTTVKSNHSKDSDCKSTSAPPAGAACDLQPHLFRSPAVQTSRKVSEDVFKVFDAICLEKHKEN